jgi:cytochrome c-type biogenesis protein CcmF
VIKAVEKPLINVLWIGTLLLMIGFTVAMVRRFREFNLMKAKGQE